MALTRDDLITTISVGLNASTWIASFERPSDQFLLNQMGYNACLTHLGPRMLEEIESNVGHGPTDVASAIVTQGEQVRLGFSVQDSDEYYSEEVDLLDFTCALSDMARLSCSSEDTVVKRLLQCGEGGRLMNAQTMGRHLVLLAAFGNDPLEIYERPE